MPNKGDDWREPPAAAEGEQLHEVALLKGVEQLDRRVAQLDRTVQSDRSTRHALVALTGLLLILFVVVGTFAAVSFHELLAVGRQNRTNGRILIECTTRGNPLAADRQDRQHECYDAAQANQQAAVRQIVDANNNGVIDTQELLEAVKALTAATTTTTTVPKR